MILHAVRSIKFSTVVSFILAVYILGTIIYLHFNLQNTFFQNERVEYDAVQYFSDAGLGPGDDVVMTDDQQKLIKVI